MKYYKESYTDDGKEIREEISKEQAIVELGKWYKNAEVCAELPCYYRTMFGGIEVTEG